MAQSLYTAGGLSDGPVVSPLTLTQIGTITGGAHGSVAIAINSAGTIAYILDGDNNILVVDVASDTITSTVVLGVSSITSGNVLLNHAETKLYVSGAASYVVDTSALTFATITNYPYTIAPGDTTGYGGYTASPGRVNIIDLASDSVTGTIDFSHFSASYGNQGALIATANNLYMLDSNNKCLDVYQFSSSSIIATVSGFTAGLGGPQRVVVNSSETIAFVGSGVLGGVVYVASLSSYSIIHTTTLTYTSGLVFNLALDAAEEYLGVGYFDVDRVDFLDASTYANISPFPGGVPTTEFTRSFAWGSSGSHQIMIM